MKWQVLLFLNFFGLQASQYALFESSWYDEVKKELDIFIQKVEEEAVAECEDSDFLNSSLQLEKARLAWNQISENPDSEDIFLPKQKEWDREEKFTEDKKVKRGKRGGNKDIRKFFVFVSDDYKKCAFSVNKKGYNLEYFLFKEDKIKIHENTLSHFPFSLSYMFHLNPNVWIQELFNIIEQYEYKNH